RAEGHAHDPASMPLESQNLLALGGIPDLHRTVAAAADEPLAVGAEGHAPYPVGVPEEGALVLVEERIEVVVLPTAQVPLARIEVLPGGKHVALLPGALSPGNLRSIHQAFGPVALLHGPAPLVVRVLARLLLILGLLHGRRLRLLGLDPETVRVPAR